MRLTHEQIRVVVQKIEAAIKEFQASAGEEQFVLNEYDVIERVLRDEFAEARNGR